VFYVSVNQDFMCLYLSVVYELAYASHKIKISCLQSCFF